MPGVYRSPGVYVEEVPSAVQAIAGVSTSTAGFIGIAPDQIELPREPYTIPTPAGVPRLCTSFSDFRRHFGDFSLDIGHNTLTHAVYGFFSNGGIRCFVVRIADAGQIEAALAALAAIDEISLVAAPGVTDDATRAAIEAHCRIATGDRFAIFDSPETVEDDRGALDLSLLDPAHPANILPANSDYAAFYFPWIEVSDPVRRAMFPDSNGRIFLPPSGHIAGVFARVDMSRGVFKAPANEVILGALGLKYALSKAQQDRLNPQGVNCIRELNGSIRIWGARTVGGDANGEWRYVNVRRTMLFLRESLDEGLQWAVFEPNDPDLWAKITRNVSAFLMTQWRFGVLVGGSPQEAFFVKCDAETNPPALQEIGQVDTVVGVALMRPSEFVILRISQWQPRASG